MEKNAESLWLGQLGLLYRTNSPVPIFLGAGFSKILGARTAQDFSLSDQQFDEGAPTSGLVRSYLAQEAANSKLDGEAAQRIAELVKNHVVAPLIITTNWDSYATDALRSAGLEVVEWESGQLPELRDVFGGSLVWVIRVHGSLDNNSTRRDTPGSVESLNAELGEFLSDLVCERGLLCIGYSFRDSGVRVALTKERSEGLIGLVDIGDLTPEQSDFLEYHGQLGHYLDIGADRGVELIWEMAKDWRADKEFVSSVESAWRNLDAYRESGDPSLLNEARMALGQGEVGVGGKQALGLQKLIEYESVERADVLLLATALQHLVEGINALEVANMDRARALSIRHQSEVLRALQLGFDGSGSRSKVVETLQRIGEHRDPFVEAERRLTLGEALKDLHTTEIGLGLAKRLTEAHAILESEFPSAPDQVDVRSDLWPDLEGRRLRHLAVVCEYLADAESNTAYLEDWREFSSKACDLLHHGTRSWAYAQLNAIQAEFHTRLINDDGNAIRSFEIDRAVDNLNQCAETFRRLRDAKGVAWTEVHKARLGLRLKDVSCGHWPSSRDATTFAERSAGVARHWGRLAGPDALATGLACLYLAMAKRRKIDRQSTDNFEDWAAVGRAASEAEELLSQTNRYRQAAKAASLKAVAMAEQAKIHDDPSLMGDALVGAAGAVEWLADRSVLTTTSFAEEVTALVKAVGRATGGDVV